MKWFFKTAVVLILSVLVIGPAFAGGGRQQGGDTGPIIIGGITDLSAHGSVLGVATANGWDMAVNDINARGGINGRQIRLITYDSRSDPQEAISLYRRLVQVDNASIVVGPPFSNLGLAVAPIAREMGVVFFGQFGDPRVMLGEDLNTLNPYMFLVQPSAIETGIIAGGYMHEVLGLRRGAILHTIDHAYCFAQGNAFIDYAREVGIELTTIQTNRQQDLDMTVQLTAIRNSGAEFIFMANPTQALVVAVNQMHQMGMTNMILTGSLDFSTPFENLVSTPAAASRIFYPVNLDMEAPELAEITRRHIQIYRSEPTPKTWIGYDTILVAEAAIRKAGSTDRRAIRDALATISGVKTLITDNFTMNPRTHMPLGLEMCMYNIENGVQTNAGWFVPRYLQE